MQRETITFTLQHTFSAAAVSIKHPGFLEEREWRIVRPPNYPNDLPFVDPRSVTDADEGRRHRGRRK
jgi:hypothetical protein